MFWEIHRDNLFLVSLFFLVHLIVYHSLIGFARGEEKENGKSFLWDTKSDRLLFCLGL